MRYGRKFDLLCSVEASTDEIPRQLPADPTFEAVAYHLAVLEHAGLLNRVGGLWSRVAEGERSA